MTLYFEQRTKTYIEEVLVPALGISVFYYVMEFAEGRGQIHFHCSARWWSTEGSSASPAAGG